MHNKTEYKIRIKNKESNNSNEKSQIPNKTFSLSLSISFFKNQITIFYCNATSSMHYIQNTNSNLNMEIANRCNANLLCDPSIMADSPCSPWIYWVIHIYIYPYIIRIALFRLERLSDSIEHSIELGNFFFARWFGSFLLVCHIVPLLCAFFNLCVRMRGIFSFISLFSFSFKYTRTVRFKIHNVSWWCCVDSSVKHQIHFVRMGILEATHTNTHVRL